MFNHLQTFPNVIDVILKFGSPWKKLHKVHKIMSRLKVLKAYVFGTKELKDKQKLQLIWTYENMVKF
jgi:hypothetical protein